jgi:hypothetical protein
MAMPKQNARLVAVKTIKKPVRLKFKTKSGKIVSFKAVQTFAKKTSPQTRATKK